MGLFRWYTHPFRNFIFPARRLMKNSISHVHFSPTVWVYACVCVSVCRTLSEVSMVNSNTLSRPRPARHRNRFNENVLSYKGGRQTTELFHGFNTFSSASGRVRLSPQPYIHPRFTKPSGRTRPTDLIYTHSVSRHVTFCKNIN